jgi:predicted RNase H-like HicB family nuclease
MKQRYHTIIKPQSGRFVGWVEEVPVTITAGISLEECRNKLKSSLELMLEINRDEARRAMDDSCIEDSIEVELHELPRRMEMSTA